MSIFACQSRPDRLLSQDLTYGPRCNAGPILFYRWSKHLTERPLPTGTLAPTKSHHRDLDDPAVVDALMGMIAEGTRTLSQIAKQLGVSSRRLHAWVSSHPEIEERFKMAVNTAKADLIAEIRNDLREIKDFDIADCIDPLTGRMLPLHDMPRQARKAIQKFKETANTTPGGITTIKREVELYNAVQARELLWKEAGALREVHDHNINPYQPVQVPVTPRLPDPGLSNAGAVDAQFTENP